MASLALLAFLALVPLTDPDGVVQVKYTHSTLARHAHFEFMAGLTAHFECFALKGPLGLVQSSES